MPATPPATRHRTRRCPARSPWARTAGPRRPTPSTSPARSSTPATCPGTTPTACTARSRSSPPEEGRRRPLDGAPARPRSDPSPAVDAGRAAGATYRDGHGPARGDPLAAGSRRPGAEPHRAVPHLARGGAGPERRRLRRPVAVVGHRPRRLLAVDLGPLPPRV